MHKKYFWLYKASEVVRLCVTPEQAPESDCLRNIDALQKFLISDLLELVAINILGPLPKLVNHT